MKIERAILITFLGNYLINNIVGALMALFHVGSDQTVQYSVYFVLAVPFTALYTWWYLQSVPVNKLTNSAIFGAIGFVVAILTAMLAGISGVIAQTGSFAQLATVLPNFGGLLLNWSTLVILGYWVVPAVVVGYILNGKKMSKGAAMPRPMI